MCRNKQSYSRTGFVERALYLCTVCTLKRWKRQVYIVHVRGFARSRARILEFILKTGLLRKKGPRLPETFAPIVCRHRVHSCETRLIVESLRLSTYGPSFATSSRMIAKVFFDWRFSSTANKKKQTGRRLPCKRCVTVQ